MSLSKSATLARIRRPGPRKGRHYRGIAISRADTAVFYRSAGGPGRPVRGRYAVFAGADRKIAAALPPGSPGLRAARRSQAAGPQNPGRSETRVSQIAGGTPVLPRGAGPRGAGPAPAERRRRFPLPKPGSGVYFGGAFSWFVLPWLAGASGPPLSRVLTLRGARTGVPHANWATWLSDVP